MGKSFVKGANCPVKNTREIKIERDFLIKAQKNNK